MYPKWTYLLISIPVLASSCSSDTIDDTGLTRGAELSFKVSNISNLSRGSVANSISRFVVYGDVKSTEEESASPVLLFNKTNVEYKNDNWTYDGIQYWIPNHEHSFVAVSPVKLMESATNLQYLNSKLSFDYTVPSQSEVADILIATHRRLYINNESASTSENSITFSFSHLLSLINFAPSFSDNKLSHDAYIMFHKLEFSGLTTKAHFDILPASRVSGNLTYDMEVDITGSENGDYSIDFTNPVRIENNAQNHKLFADDDAIILLPQAFAIDSEASITLSYTVNDDKTMNYVNIPLKELKWESGRSYTYNFSIERSGVVLGTCEINPWNVIPGEEIVVE